MKVLVILVAFAHAGPARGRPVRVASAWLALSLLARAAFAQDFVPPTPVPIAPAPLVALDRGLASEGAGCEIATAATRLFGLEPLRIAAVTAGGGWQRLRFAVGLAGCGDPEIGWNAAGASMGWVEPGAGFAVRAVGRRDRLDPALIVDSAPAAGGAAASGRAAPRDGGEIGVGAWIRLDAAVRLWVSHPQLVTSGAAAPLERGLEAGASWRGAGVMLWGSRAAAPRGVGAETHRLGIGLPFASGTLWVEASDAPLRVAGGCAVNARGLELAASVETHPALGETVRLGIAARRP